ncbi:CHD5-like protein-domain-containing protein [Dactylonectria macrodidyma]|uniref:CHD5-like protein-domain-containing protein n=1 Tax=Dactylonectria macrodidyma TaxID=307937 RepID=A0A9P9FFG6_9HYPO|nr:CHD5-like protein-domain-containing protein [Dactylonectria macrodidyma]
MPSLLVSIFVVEVVINVINAIGATAINNLLWTLINFLPIPTSKAASEQRKLQADYLKVRRELNATSSQDEFAKWAKLRRQHDKQLELLEKKKKSTEAARSQFDTYLTAVRVVVTRAPQYFLPFWYATEPMFWLPHGWFPYYAEWILSFPRAPIGSVSIASWQLACTAVIAMFSDVIVAIIGLALGGKKEEAPIAAKPTAEKKSGKAASTEKKEL